jgi:hypothetical protein
MRLRIPNFITPYSAHFVPTSEPASFDELRSGRLNVSDYTAKWTERSQFPIAALLALGSRVRFSLLATVNLASEMGECGR